MRMKRSLLKSELSVGIMLTENSQDRAYEVEGKIRKIRLKIRNEVADAV